MKAHMRIPVLTFVLILFGLSRDARCEPQTLQDRLIAEGATNLAKSAQSDGDAVRGAIVFHQPSLSCTKCHQTEPSPNGFRLAPDLTRLEKVPSAESLVESVLEPSKIIRKGFEPVVIQLHDGRTLTGLIVDETEEKLVVGDIARLGERVTLQKSLIEDRSRSLVSIMPTGQVNILANRQQFLDLIKYLIEISAGGPERARQLAPPPSLFALVVPEYEKQIDHAGLLHDLDDKSFQRGEAIYSRLCINCHGTKDKPGSLPTSLKFAEGKFKNGSDPHRMYQTLTHGFGLMAPQTWMVPQQKYDVIHYVRETYLKPHNPSQYATITAEYLASLPKGNTRGPAPSNVEPWSSMNYGPFLTATYEVGADGSNFAYKGIAVRLDSGPGGVSRGSHWQVFDHDTLRLAAVWSASADDKSRFIDWHGINFDGRHQVHPRVSGQVQNSNPSGPGWANPETGSFDDPRIVGRDGNHYGPLPRKWGRYRGLYQFGDQVILSYTVGETDVFEMPGVVDLGATVTAGSSSWAKEVKEKGGDVKRRDDYRTAPILTRTFHIGARSRSMVLKVSTHPAQEASLWAFNGAETAIPNTSIAASKSPIVMFGDSQTDLLAGLSPVPTGTQWMSGANGALLLLLPAGDEPLKFVLSTTIPQGNYFSNNVRQALVTQPPLDLTSLTKGGPARWPEEIATDLVPGTENGPFAVDVLSIPSNNPWFAQLRLTGFDFFEDGNRMAVCTWDGDVWLVSGFLGPGLRSQSKSAQITNPTDKAATTDSQSTQKLTWRRIANGLFQPLGLKIVRDQIYVTCRDQIAVLHDLNGDLETDFVECFNNDHQVTDHFHEFAMGLQTDAEGNFYYAKSARHALPAVVPHHGTLLRVSADGSHTDILANGFRAANGVCLNPDGTFVVTDQEGHWNPKNRINWVTAAKPGEKPRFYGNMFGYHDVTDSSDSAMERPLCWITNDFDRSPAELLWVASEKWGPLKGSLLNLSYGYGKVFVVPHESINLVEDLPASGTNADKCDATGTTRATSVKQMQGGMCELPLPLFPTGIMRGRFHPQDGQLYTCGMFAWAGNATQPGGFYRIRATGRQVHLPIELHARKAGMQIRFSGKLQATRPLDPSDFTVRTWSLKRTAEYGSKHYDEKTLTVTSARLLNDHCSVMLEIPGIAPTWCMSIEYRLTGSEGEPIRGLIHNTIHGLGE
jgi:putative heme-binding domain-containing protein